MPFAYDMNLSANSNGVANTETDHMLGIAGATQGYAVDAIFGNIRTGVTVGAAALRFKTGGTSAAGTAATANKRDANSPATGSSWTTAITAAGSPVVRISVGLSQTGLQNGWVARDDYHKIRVAPGVSNKGELFSIANTATQGIDTTVEFMEGAG